ncbi:hypothetical protein NDU88_001817 [Pleurodeles waltl]|uniref:Uncharacterized protein n=1 Tax=Pleurodeles waltl TaxID=8319 RepID=A0AAV7KSY0_PLEWA|nr:hypothetical protein NDU88_001817 [Pleurodeles waltl]
MSPGEGPSHRTLPPGLDALLSQVITQGLAPIKESMAQLAEQVSTGPGMFGGAGADFRFSEIPAPRKLRKRDAGHLEDVWLLADVFGKSAHVHKRIPFREGSLPRVSSEKLYHILGPDSGSPKRITEDSDGDASSVEDHDSGHPWHPGAFLPDPQEQDDSGSEMFEPLGIYHPRSSEWRPEQKVAEYVASKIRQPLDKGVRAWLKAECPHPTLPDRVAATPDIDLKMCTFFAKYTKEPQEGY